MKFKDLFGKEININLTNYLVDWDAKERSKIQFKVKKFLQPYWKNNIVCSELRVVSTRMTLDLYNATKRIAIEIQGNQHQKFNKFYHSNSRTNYLGQIKRDLKKVEFCELNNIKLIEVFEHEIDDLSKEWFLKTYNVTL